MSIYRSHQGPRSTVAHHPLMAAMLGVALGGGFLVAGASIAAGAEAQPFCSEYDVPEEIAPVEVAPTEVTAPTTPEVVAPIAVVPVVAEPAPAVPEPAAPAPIVVAPAEVPAPATAVAPTTEVLGEVVVNDQVATATLPVTGVPTAELLMVAVGLLLTGQALRRTANRRIADAVATAGMDGSSPGGLVR